MKTIGFVLMLSALIAGLIQYYFVLRPKLLPSDEAAILTFITRPKEYPVGVAFRGDETYPCAFIIDSVFRAFNSNTQTSARDHRKDILKRALTHTWGHSYRQALDFEQLTTPSTSANLKLLRTHCRQGCKSVSSYSLTISSACAAKDGKQVYYTEQIHLGDKKGRGTIYVIKNRKVEKEVNVWIN